MNFEFFGVKIKITFLFVAVICFMLFIDRTGLIIPLFLAVFAHESAHIAAMWFLNCAPREIELIPGSIKIINPQKFSFRKENIILVCGPLCNIIFFALLYSLFLFFGKKIILIYAVIQLIVGAFNLLPAKGLDGGQLINNLLTNYFSVSAAGLIYTILSALVGGMFLAYGFINLINGSVNASVFILGFYIIILSFTNKC
jgi:Zn-dependent protease